MESNVHSYQLTQKNKVYILTTSVLGNDIKISVKDKAGTMAFSRSFTIETWKKIGAVFEAIQNAQDAIQWINKTLKTHKVKVIEAGNMVKIIFFIVENRTKHLVEIPISEGGQINATLGTASTTLSSTAVVDTNIDTSSFATGAVETTNIDTTAFNTGDVVSSNVQTTSYDAGAMMEAQSQIMQQGAATTNTTTTTTTEVNFSREIGLDPSKIVNQTVNPNTQEIINSIEEEKKLRLSQVGKVVNTSGQSSAFQEASQFQSTDFQIPEQTTTNITTENINLNQFTTTTTDVAPDLTAQYTTSTEAQNFTVPDTSSQINFQEYQASSTPVVNTQFTETNTQISNVAQASSTTQNYSLPYITPADETVPTVNMEIKAEPAPVEMNFENYTQNTTEINAQPTPVEMNFENYTQNTTEINAQPTPVEMNFENYTQNTNNEVNYDQYQATETATTTTTTQFDTQNNAQDERLVKLEGDTNSLKNEHQEIQAKLSNLLNQVNSYKSQVESLEREKNSRELSALRAENAAIKQQLSELNSLRREAAEVQMLRSQVAQMDPLRRKAAELDSLRGQLNELNMLKSKVAELSGLQGQLSEINNLKAQISQMNLSQQNAQDDEKEMLKRKLQELENLKMQYEQEIKTLKGAKSSVVKESSGLEKTQHLFEEKTQQISVKGDIIHNTEELELITRKINKSNKKITLNLLYKATVDSDKAKAFHDKCDQAQSSLVLIETDKGKRFGGFTTCSWAGECEEKKDEDAFVFSLDKMMTYDNIQGEDAIGCYPKFGPIFLGCQIRIYDNAFSKGGTTFEKGLNYNTEEDYELTGGERIFNVKEIEVYEVIAQ
jgi:hypothetical protein